MRGGQLGRLRCELRLKVARILGAFLHIEKKKSWYQNQFVLNQRGATYDFGNVRGLDLLLKRLLPVNIAKESVLLDGRRVSFAAAKTILGRSRHQLHGHKTRQYSYNITGVALQGRWVAWTYPLHDRGRLNRQPVWILHVVMDNRVKDLLLIITGKRRLNTHTHTQTERKEQKTK